MLSHNNYNPDVLTCLANLSSDEVFTPPKLVNQILDLLPQEIWSDKNATFLDPVCKSGVFLREIAKRLMTGLEKQIPDIQTRINHIYKNQLFGIAITELTSLLSRRSVYCSKTANGRYSICETYDDPQGNIRFDRIEHTWKNGRCIYCGTSQMVYDRDETLETHAYQFIHTKKPEELFDMRFDVIIGNPPYQLSDGGHGMSAKPIYQHFVNQAKKLNPRFLTMIIPSRWFAGGKGLDNFRKSMLNDKRIRKLVDYENSNKLFPGVDVAGGICYFLWDRDSAGLCEVTNFHEEQSISSKRVLNEYDILIRNNRAVSIVKKILEKNKENGKYLNEIVSSRKPFGLPTNYQPQNEGVPCWFIQRIGLRFANRLDVLDRNKLLDKWELLIPKAPIAGQTDFSKPVGFYYDSNVRTAKPGECCTESWIVAGAFSTEQEVISYKSYIFTKIVRFLILQTVISQDVTKKNFSFVPDLGLYKGNYSDELLKQKWDITNDEWEFIDSKIS
jgi:site-specific DNA-methyltransferase (adenine-specific)